jgi:hypothetical protein
MGLQIQSWDVDEAAAAAVTCLDELMQRLGIPSLSSIGVKESDIPALVTIAMRNTGNPDQPRRDRRDRVHQCLRGGLARPSSGLEPAVIADAMSTRCNTTAKYGAAPMSTKYSADCGTVQHS